VGDMSFYEELPNVFCCRLTCGVVRGISDARHLLGEDIAISFRPASKAATRICGRLWAGAILAVIAAVVPHNHRRRVRDDKPDAAERR